MAMACRKALHAVFNSGCPSNSCRAYGFSALPAGYKNFDGDFNISHEASEAAKHAWPFLSRLGKRLRHAGNNAYSMNLNYNNDNANLSNDTKNFGFSVRCLQNN